MRLSEQIRKAEWDDVDSVVDPDWADEADVIETKLGVMRYKVLCLQLTMREVLTRLEQEFQNILEEE